MRMVLVRHGDALPRDQDPQRGLSPLGRQQAASVGARLAGLGVAVARILHSGKARARQTAEEIASGLPDAPAPEQAEGLRPNDPVEPVVRQILAADQAWLIVSHLPFVQYLTAVLMTHKDQSLPDFSTGTAVVLERDELNGSFRIAHIIQPAA